MADKILVGNVKVVSTQYGDITKVGFKEEDLELLKSHIKGGWVNLEIKTGKSGKLYGEISQFVPSGGSKQQSEPVVESPRKPKVDDDSDLPF